MSNALVEMTRTEEQYQEIISACRSLFLKKAKDYGTSWTILRMPSITDQILIKAERIRSIEEKQVNKVGEGIADEYRGIINYCIIAMILLEIREKTSLKNEIQKPEILQDKYDDKADLAFRTMQAKNHDYGEAWRKMRISSLTDLILMKIMRLKQIEDNEGKLLASEGPEANYIDMLNYSVFALIRLKENASN